MKRNLLLTLLMLLLLPSLTACWNQKELTDLAFVMALGVDKGENERYSVSFQFVIPGNVSMTQGGSGKGLPIAVVKGTGNTLTEAARNVTKIVGRQLYYAHTNLLVISDEIANNRELLLGIFDSLGRDPEFRRTTELVIAKNAKAEEILTALNLLEKLPVNKITQQIKTNEKMLGEDVKVNLDEFITSITSAGKEPIVTGYLLKGEKDQAKKAEILEKTIPDAFLMSNGLAVFKEEKLTGWINGSKARGVLWVLDKVKSTNININWNGKKDAINMAPIRSKTKISINFKFGKPVILVAVENEGWISEANIAVDLTNPKEIAKIEKKVEENIKKEIFMAIDTAQNLKSDIFGFGERIHRADPELWKKIKGDWGEHFAELEVKVKVNTYIRREGVRTNPFWSNINK